MDLFDNEILSQRQHRDNQPMPVNCKVVSSHLSLSLLPEHYVFLQFTVKQLERLAKKSEKEQKVQETKVKKVG